jgi:hypothetical protein
MEDGAFRPAACRVTGAPQRDHVHLEALVDCGTYLGCNSHFYREESVQEHE